MSNIQIIYEILVFIKFKFLNKFSRVPRRNLYRRFDSLLSHWCDTTSAQIRPSANPWIVDGGVVAFFGNGRKIRDSTTPRRLEEARLDGRRICSQPDRNEIQSVLSVTFSFPPSCLRLETSDSVIDICAFSCASLLSSGSHRLLSFLIPLSTNRRVASLLFSRLLSERNPLSKKYPSKSFVIRSLLLDIPSSFPSPIVIAISTSAAKRTTFLRDHPLSPVYVIFSLESSRCPFVRCLDIWELTLCCYHFTR